MSRASVKFIHDSEGCVSFVVTCLPFELDLAIDNIDDVIFFNEMGRKLLVSTPIFLDRVWHHGFCLNYEQWGLEVGWGELFMWLFHWREIDLAISYVCYWVALGTYVPLLELPTQCSFSDFILHLFCTIHFASPQSALLVNPAKLSANVSLLINQSSINTLTLVLSVCVRVCPCVTDVTSANPHLDCARIREKTVTSSYVYIAN